MKHEQLVFKVIEYGMKRQYFTFSQLVRDLNLPENDKTYLWQSLTCSKGFETQNPNHILITIQHGHEQVRKLSAKDYLYTVLPTAIVSYVDYLEIVEARKNSRQAFVISLLAIGISIAIGAVQIYYQVTTATNATGNG